MLTQQKIDYKDYHPLIIKILIDKYRDYDMQYLGEAWLAFKHAVATYNPEKGKFSTWLASNIRDHMTYVLRYSGKLIHTPALKEGATLYSLDKPIDEDGTTWQDLIHMDEEKVDFNLTDVNVPPKYENAYNDVLEAIDSGLSEKAYLKQKYGNLAHSKQVGLTNFRKYMSENRKKGILT